MEKTDNGWLPEAERISRKTKFKSYYRIENWAITTFIRRFDNILVRKQGNEELLIWVPCDCFKEMSRGTTSWSTCEKHIAEADAGKFREFYNYIR